MTLTPSYRAYAHAHGHTAEQMLASDGNRVGAEYRWLAWRREQCKEFRTLHEATQPGWFDVRSTEKNPFLTDEGREAFDAYLLAKWPSVRGEARR